ncbi:MAG: hypothetical protein R2713_03080 [Ilumatobacteraceae bacterium]
MPGARNWQTSPAVIVVDDAQRRARLAQRHRLVPHARALTPAEAADAVVALHATTPPRYLSAMARLAQPSVTAAAHSTTIGR